MTTMLNPELDQVPDTETPTSRGHIGRTVTLSILGGLALAVIAVVGPFAGSEEHVIAGTVLLSFATSWALLAHLSRRRTDQPQSWARVPATAMAVAATVLLVFEPTGNEAGWVWPPTVLALVVWMVIQSRRQLHSRARLLVLYPVFAALALSAVGGAYETYFETTDTTTDAMPGRLVDVGGHSLHINCVGTGSPTVVLEGGLGEPSTIMASWIAPNVAPTTRVCVYDRPGRGWSEPAGHPQDGVATATDLHTLLERAGEPGPYVLAGHSLGGIYVLNFANLYPADVAGVVLLDSMHPQQYERIPSWPGFYEMFRRASAVVTPLSRFGIMRVVNEAQFSNLPSPQREQERAFLSTPSHNRSVRDEFHMIRAAMDQAAALHTLGDIPLVVVTARRGQERGWFEAQDQLATLSSNSGHRFLADADHAMVVGDETTARLSSDAVLEVIRAVRLDTPITSEEP
jgi:pimeloyl-ACP methyl ester carboxylesterase